MRKREQNIEIIREACIAANPMICEQSCDHKLMHDEGGCPVEKHCRPIRLADVLVAMGRGRTYETSAHFLYIPATTFSYNIRKDDLTLQSDEFLQFAADLLAPTQDK